MAVTSEAGSVAAGNPELVFQHCGTGEEFYAKITRNVSKPTKCQKASPAMLLPRNDSSTGGVVLTGTICGG